MVTRALGKPVNVLALPLKEATVAHLADAGAKRISTGGSRARAAIGALLQAGAAMRERGSFEWASHAASGADVKKLLSAWVT